MHAVRWRILFGALALLLAVPVAAERLLVPLFLDAEALELLMRERLFGDGRLRVEDDGSGCQYVELRDPEVRAEDGRLLLQARAKARAGRRVGGRCLLVLDWRGGVELIQRPTRAPDGDGIVLSTESWRTVRADGSTDEVSTTVGRRLEQFLPATLTPLYVDLAGPLLQLRDLLGGMTASAATGGIELGSLAVDEVAIGTGPAGQNGARLTLGIDVHPVPRTAAAPEPALAEAELATLEQRLNTVDAFFTYAIRTLDPARVDTRQVFEVLVELRREALTILREPGGRGEDPVRRLFIDAWRGFVPVLRGVAAGKADHRQALGYLTFIGAGDALAALDALGPSMGVEISRDGLRRLARLLAPGATDDPLERTDAVDAELRRALGFGEPLPSPRDGDETSWVDDWLELLVPRAAASEALDPTLVEKLNNWVPRDKDMDVYLPMAREVLRYATTAELADSGLDGGYRELFRDLVLAAAWQESCWRQFEAKNDMRVPVESASGDLGVMQINPTVWRGLYDLQGLRWDIVYNARAGADILEHYLVAYALRHAEHKTTGSVDSLARSAYAAYNGGPRQYDRYRRAAARADKLFYEKYRQVKQEDLAVTACYDR